MKLKMLTEHRGNYLVLDGAGLELYWGKSLFVARLVATVMDGRQVL
jgi:hypothetical protein